MTRQAQNFPRSKEFSKHSDNLRELKRSRTQIERLHKSAIRRNSLEEIETLSQVQYMFIGIEAEATLRKIVADPTGLSPAEQEIVWQKSSKTEQWITLLDVAFKHHYDDGSIPSWTAGNLTPDIQARHKSLVDLVNNNLKPVTERRNKLAHGQWVWLLKSRQDNKFILGDRQDPPPDYVTLRELARAIQSLAEIVSILTVSRPAFERDFEKHYRKFEYARDQIEQNQSGAVYEKFVSDLCSTTLRSRTDNAEKL